MLQRTMADMHAPSIRYSLVVPIFNEEEVLPLLMARLTDLLAGLDAPAEIIFVDDVLTTGGTALAAMSTLGVAKNFTVWALASRAFGCG